MSDAAEHSAHEDPPEPRGIQTANSMLWTKVNYVQREIKHLQEHDKHCDEQHSYWNARDEQHKEESEQNRAAIKQNADAMIELSHSLTSINDTIIKKVLPVVERANKEYTIRDWLRKEGFPYAVLILGILLNVKHLFGG